MVHVVLQMGIQCAEIGLKDPAVPCMDVSVRSLHTHTHLTIIVCGDTDAHCGTGCQSGPCVGAPASPAPGPSPAPANPVPGTLAIVGQAGVPAMHAGLMPNGRVIFLDKVENYTQIQLSDGQYAYSAEYDPETNQVVGLQYEVSDYNLIPFYPLSLSLTFLRRMPSVLVVLSCQMDVGFHLEAMLHSTSSIPQSGTALLPFAISQDLAAMPHWTDKHGANQAINSAQLAGMLPLRLCPTVQYLLQVEV